MTFESNADKQTTNWEEAHQNGHKVLVLKRGQHPIGLLIAYENTLLDESPTLYVEDLYIAESERGNPGILRKLIEEVSKMAHASGVDSISWYTTGTSKQMQGISKKLTNAKIVSATGKYNVMPLEKLNAQTIFRLLKEQRKSAATIEGNA